MIENRREAMKAKHALYLGLIIIGAAFLLLISALLEWADGHREKRP